MLDGSYWTIIARYSGRSHVIHRTYPDRQIRELGQLFIELAGSEEIEEYSRSSHFRTP